VKDILNILMEKPLRDYVFRVWPVSEKDKIDSTNYFFKSMKGLAEQFGTGDITETGYFEVTVHYDFVGFEMETYEWGAVFAPRDGVLCRFVYPDGSGTPFWSNTKGTVSSNLQIWVKKFEKIWKKVPLVEEVPFAYISHDARGYFITKEPYWQFVSK
jgi:hypothetical protein